METRTAVCASAVSLINKIRPFLEVPKKSITPLRGGVNLESAAAHEKEEDCHRAALAR